MNLSKWQIEQLNRNIRETAAQVKRMSLAELKNGGIDPDSEAGREFLLRVRSHGIMGAQPPRPELNE